MVDPIVDSFLLNIKMNMNSYKEFIIIILYTSSMTPSDDILKIYISPEYNTLRMFYHARVEQHNNMIDTDPFADSGFDLGIPTPYTFHKHWGNKVPLGVCAAMWTSDGIPLAYYLYPRSSISKTPMRLSNSTGIIDRGYRGELMAMVDIIDHNKIPYEVNALDRHFQICHPSLGKFKVELVDSKESLGVTSRGNGGFGSSGR